MIRVILTAATLALWAPGALCTMDAGVVRIESALGGKTRFGSGFVVRIEGDAAYVATAAHVVEGDPKPKVYFHARPHRPGTARVLALEGGDPRGLALLLVDAGLPQGVEALPMAAGGGFDLARGDVVSALGIPASLRTWAVIPGAVVSWKNRDILFSGWVDEGNSGGPLVRGQAVAGLVMGVRRRFGMAVPAMSVRIFLQSNGVTWATGTQAASRSGKAKTQPERPQTVARKAGETFRDCDVCPEMVVIPAGAFRMGSLDGEAGRAGDEGPVHDVRFAQPFALGRREVTVGQFRAFVEATGHRTQAEKGEGCYVWGGSSWSKDSMRNWRSPGFEQGEEHPVVCVSWKDAQAYVGWLSRITGKAYRLPSEAEWEYAARAGTTAARFWGDDPNAACRYANVHDNTGKRENDFGWPHHECDDGYANTAPVGRFEVNRFGLADILGNVREWTHDCWNGSYEGAPRDGAAWTEGDCQRRVLRGGSWGYVPGSVRSANRIRDDTGDRDFDLGFRPARTF